MTECRSIAWLLAAALGLGALAARAQVPPPPGAAGAPASASADDGLVQLDFNDVELGVVIDTIAKLTNKNFIYDDRVRGRVTIVSPTRIPVAQAYTVFESVLNVKGFTTVAGPGGSIKIVPVRDAKESAIDTVPAPTPTPNIDTYVTRLIPLKYIDADAISNSLKPLVSKDAALLSYPPTNTIILTDSAANIRRILSIIAAIDVETFKEELTLLKVLHADAATLAQQIADIYGGEVSSSSATGASALRSARPRTQPQIPGVPTPAGVPGSAEQQRDRVRIITDARTNSLIVLSSRTRIEDIRRLVAKLDVPVTGGGRIHVYYLKNADAEELAETLNSVISGQPAAPKGGAGGAQSGAGAGAIGPAAAQALRAAVTELAEGVSITADKPTNALIIQASQEGFATAKQVIERLDIRRPQVLVEALIMEVTVSNNQQLGLNSLYRHVGDASFTVASLTDSAGRPRVFGSGSSSSTDGSTTDSGGSGDVTDSVLSNLIAVASKNSLRYGAAGPAGIATAVGGSLIEGILRASENLNNANILSAPHILTSDNEEAEIKVGNNIPIISSRVQSAAGVTNATGDLATSVNVERQDIGITLRVTPQISEGDTLRLKIFQEITNINRGLIADTGDPSQVGVPLSSRKIENNVVVSDGETVVIGGLLDNNQQNTESKVPWLGDIPFLGWAFKSTTDQLTKINLLVFLTPHIVRNESDLEQQSIRKREEFQRESAQAIDQTEDELEQEEARREEAEAKGVPYEPPKYTGNAIRDELAQLSARYPLARMGQIEEQQAAERERREQAERESEHGPKWGVLAAIFRSESAARAQLTELVDAGYDGTLRSGQQGGGVFYELRLGPYDTTEQANHVAEAVRRGYGLAPTVIQLEPAEAAAP
ncbi:MAG: type II secretion system secretin GspD [Deltaproteobacteria bacterium]|nr:type II secretion system secretin GspD [Deltaproteobacteria bacterium]